jgi:lipase chaperone LimK
MKILRNATLWSLLVLISLAIFGCGKKDEDRPVSEVKTEAGQLDKDQLRAKVLKYKEAIVANKLELEKLTAKLKTAPLTEISDEDAKRVEDLNRSISALKKHFEVYYQELRKKGGDTSGLEI